MNPKAPTISYREGDEQPLHPNAQYLIMQAGIENGTYDAAEFLERIMRVPTEEIQNEEGRHELRNQKIIFDVLTQQTKQVTIRNFAPDRARLEAFVETSFIELLRQARRV